MAKFMTIQRDGELDRLIGSLTQSPFGHVHSEDVRITDPLRARQTEWAKIHKALQNGIDAVLTASFVEDGVPLCAYLLGPLRAYPVGSMRAVSMKVGMITEQNPPFQRDQLIEEVPVTRIPDIGNVGANRLLEEVQIILPQLGAGRIVFVEDTKEGQSELRRTMTPPTLAGRRVEVVDFPRAHDLLLNQEPPALIVTDTVEKVGGGMGDRTGLGLYVILRSTPRFQDIGRLLFSYRLYGSPNDPDPQGDLRAFDAAFEDDPQIPVEPSIHDFLCTY